MKFVTDKQTTFYRYDNSKFLISAGSVPAGTALVLGDKAIDPKSGREVAKDGAGNYFFLDVLSEYSGTKKPFNKNVVITVVLIVAIVSISVYFLTKKAA